MVEWVRDPTVEGNEDILEDHELRITALEADAQPPVSSDASWEANLNPNTLVANVVVFNFTIERGRAWRIVVDSATVPTNDAVIGSSPPTGFTRGDFSIAYSASSYSASEDWYFYEYDDVAGIVLVLSTTGDDFVTVTPNDTLGPIGLSISAVGAVVTLVAATDAGIGLATNPYKIFVDGALFLDNIGQADLTHTIDKPAGDYSVYYTAQDVNGNPTDSNAITVTIAAGGIGTVGFTDVLHEFTENAAGTYLVELSTPGTGGYDVDVSIIEQTALDTTTDAALGQFARKAGETISIGAAATYDVTITLDNDSGAMDINQAFMVIDFDQAALGGALVSSPSTRLLITGSGATGDSGYQMSDVSPYDLTVEAEGWAQGGAIRNSIESGNEADAFSEAGWGTRDLGNHMTAQTSANVYGSDTVLNTEAPYIQYQLAISSAAVAANDPATLGIFDLFTRCIKNPTAGTFHCSLVRDVTSIAESGGTVTVTLAKKHGMSGGETIYFEDVEGTNASWYNDTGGHVVAAATPDATTFTITAGSPPTGDPDASTGNVLGADINLIGCDDSPYTTTFSNAEWEWSLLDGVTQASMYINNAGTWDFRIYMYSNTHRVDRFSILARAAGANGSTAAVNVIDAGEKTNSQDDDMGLLTSIYATGSADPQEDPNNLPNLFVPLPTATVSLTNDHVSPDFGQEGVGVTTKIVIDLTGMSELEINDFRMLEPNTSRRENTSYTVNGMVATLDPGFMTEGIFYNVEIDARVRDTDGVVKTISFTTDPWRFKTAVATAALFEQDFSSTTPLASGVARDIPLSEAITLFDAPYLATSSNTSPTFTDGRAQLVGDPFNEGNGRGNVIQFNQYQGAVGWFGTCNFMNPSGFGAYDELWFSFDIGLPLNFECNRQNHTVVLRAFNFNPDQSPQGSGEFACFMDLHGNNPGVSSPLGKIDNHVVIYFYHQTCNQRWWFSRFDDPDFTNIACEPCCQNPKPGAVYAGLQKGRFHHMLIHVAKNTVGTTDATANGVCEFFMDGRPIVQKYNVPWTNPASPKDWEAVGFDHYSSTSDPIPQDQVIYYDRLRVSNTEIT